MINEAGCCDKYSKEWNLKIFQRVEFGVHTTIAYCMFNSNPRNEWLVYLGQFGSGMGRASEKCPNANAVPCRLDLQPNFLPVQHQHSVSASLKERRPMDSSSARLLLALLTGNCLLPLVVANLATPFLQLSRGRNAK
eukprot:EG_transcript_30691